MTNRLIKTRLNSSRKINAIPVVYYHSVGTHKEKKNWSFLSCDLKTFTLQMKFLAKMDYKTCHWNELENHLNGTQKLPKRTIHIQFDDGFLDNWTVVFPIMKTYGLKFSIVVSPEFIGKNKIRPFCSNPNEDNLSDWWGYLSKDELVEMERSGLVDIQAHGYSHTWYPVSDQIEDVFDGSQISPWIFWNENTEDKVDWLLNDNIKTYKLGFPMFKNEKSLSNLKAFIPNEEFILESINIYNLKNNTRENLIQVQRLADKYRINNNLGRYETNEEALERLKKELLGTRVYLSKLLNKPIDYLVWPGGGNNEFVQQLAFECGYRLISKGKKLNSFNSRNKKISRVAAYKEFKPKIISSYLNVVFLQLQILRASGNAIIGSLANTIKKVIK